MSQMALSIRFPTVVVVGDKQLHDAKQVRHRYPDL